MKTLGMTSFGLAVLLLAGGLLAGAEPSRTTPQAKIEQKGDQQVDIKMDEVVSIAVGEKATANMSIGHLPAQPSGDRKITVRVGKIYRQAVGPKASVCIQIPFVTDSNVCDESHHDGTDSEQ
jgi:hypothetical protein